MGKLIAAIQGIVTGAKLGTAEPKGLLIMTLIFDLLALVLAFAGNPLGGFIAVVTGLMVFALGVRFGGGPMLCLASAFFQFFFVLGILVAPSSAGAYLLLNIACLAYPVAKALF